MPNRENHNQFPELFILTSMQLPLCDLMCIHNKRLFRCSQMDWAKD